MWLITISEDCKGAIYIAEFVKKTLVGYKSVSDGSADSECTHVVLTYDEYDKMVMGRAKAENDAIEAQKHAAALVEQVKQNARSKIIEEQKECQKTIDSLNEKLAEEKRESEYLAGLNENLLRIARERANADRKLKPKKEHTGYVVVSSTEKEYRYKVDRRNWETVTLWETVLQSPYSIDFTEEQAREQTKELTGNDGKGVWLVFRLGINASYSGKYEDMLEETTWSDQQKKELNIMLKRKLRANYRSRYWEVIISHTKPLGIVPNDMRI